MKKLLLGLMALFTLSVAQADQVLVIDAGYSTVTTNVKNRLEAAGHTVTVTSNVGLVPSSTGSYQQVWDLRYAAALTSSEVTAYTAFITGGGFAYFVTENPGCCMSRNNSVAALVTGLGGGTTTIGGNGGNWAGNIESNVNTTYMTNGITVNYAAVAAIVNSQGIPLISDSAGQVSGMSWIGRAGALGSGVTGTIVTVADTNWLDSSRMVTDNTNGTQPGTTAQNQNTQALDDIIRGIVAGTVAGTISSSGNGAGATNGNSGSSAPTVVSTSTTNTVTTADSRGSSTTTSSTVNSTSTSTDQVTRGTPVAVTVETRAPVALTRKNLTIGQTFTTTTTTPVTTVTTTVTPFTTTTVVTTPVTTTTTTTPVTTDTMSDNSTVVTTGTPVVTTSTVNEVVTTTQTGTLTSFNTVHTNDVAVAAVTHNHNTRVDQFDKLIRANGNTNTLLDSAVTDRVGIEGNHFVGQDGPQGYVVLDANRSNTADSYYMKSQRMGVGFDYRLDAETIVGAQYNRHTTNLYGDNASGRVTKDHFGIYSLHNVNEWLIKNDLAYAFNRVETHHSLPALGYANQAKTNGADYWVASRLYTPDFIGFRPFVGVRYEHNYGKAVVETGSWMTAMMYEGYNTWTRNEEVGVSFEQKLTDNFTVKSEVNRTTLNYKAASLALSYQVEKTTAVDFKVGQQRWDDVKNNTVQLNAKFLF